MTLTIQSRVQINGFEGVVNDVKILLTNGVRLRYFNVLWDQSSQIDVRLYREQDLIEIPPYLVQFLNQESRFKRIRLDKTLILFKTKFMTEFDIVKFLNPAVKDERLLVALAISKTIEKNATNVHDVRSDMVTSPPRTRNKKASVVKHNQVKKMVKTNKVSSTSSFSNMIDLTVSSESENEHKEFKPRKRSLSKYQKSSCNSDRKKEIVDLTVSSDSDDHDGCL
jgi:hypothetical protein